jgi:hypothetical protein
VLTHYAQPYPQQLWITETAFAVPAARPGGRHRDAGDARAFVLAETPSRR